MSEPIKFFWSRTPGKFVDKTSGEKMFGASFDGTVREWYETLIEVMVDLGLTSQRSLGGNPLKYVSWRADANISLIVECSVLYQPIESRREIGVIGGGGHGLIMNIPIKPCQALYNTGMLELIQFEDSDHERVLGRLEVIDAIIK